jgi:pyridoxal phosphate enzyme (YggS family)
MDRERLGENLQDVRSRIGEAARRSGRNSASVTLVAVTKRSPSEWIRPLVALGVADLGENYPQELWRKVDELGSLPARWHLIGHLQSNKARRTMAAVQMIHSVDSLKLLGELTRLAGEPAGGNAPQLCLQINTSAEEAKHGWSPESILSDADAIAACTGLPIVGLMTMAGLGTTAATARPSFARLRVLRDELRARTGLPLDHLSMGMSNDFEAAIEEGATLVRVGSALFEGVGP